MGQAGSVSFQFSLPGTRVLEGIPGAQDRSSPGQAAWSLCCMWESLDRFVPQRYWKGTAYSMRGAIGRGQVTLTSANGKLVKDPTAS